jgi:hypothetical protein
MNQKVKRNLKPEQIIQKKIIGKLVQSANDLVFDCTLNSSWLIIFKNQTSDSNPQPLTEPETDLNLIFYLVFLHTWSNDKFDKLN